jgi:hypothetical protein
MGFRHVRVVKAIHASAERNRKACGKYNAVNESKETRELPEA